VYLLQLCNLLVEHADIVLHDKRQLLNLVRLVVKQRLTFRHLTHNGKKTSRLFQKISPHQNMRNKQKVVPTNMQFFRKNVK